MTTRYTITDLGTLGANSQWSEANALNNRGQVVGEADKPVNPALAPPGIFSVAFLWERGTMENLGTLDQSDSRAYDINDRGEVVGEVGAVRVHSPSPRGFLWRAGKMIDLGPLVPGSPRTDRLTPYSINNKSQTAGDGVHGDGRCAAFRWEKGRFTILPTSGGWCEARAINDAGTIVGSTPGEQETSGRRAVAWAKNNTAAALKPLARGGSGHALDINNRGQIVGQAHDGPTPSTGRAVLWRNGSVVALAPLGGSGHDCVAKAINNRGQIVGHTIRPLLSEYRAILWEDGKPVGLNRLVGAAPGWTLNQGRDINDRGQIVGKGTFEGRTRAFLLTPK